MRCAHTVAFRCCLASEGWRSVELTHPCMWKKKVFPLLQLNNLSAASLGWWQFSPKLALFISRPVLFPPAAPPHLVCFTVGWCCVQLFLCAHVTNVTEHQFTGFYCNFSRGNWRQHVFLTEMSKNRAQQACHLSIDVPWLAYLTLLTLQRCLNINNSKFSCASVASKFSFKGSVETWHCNRSLWCENWFCKQQRSVSLRRVPTRSLPSSKRRCRPVTCWTAPTSVRQHRELEHAPPSVRLRM